jgi:hypothetical protein
MEALCECPQNNLKIVTPSSDGPHPLVESLQLAACLPQGTSDESLSKLQSIVTDILLEEPLLQSILTIQQESAGEVQALEVFREVLNAQRVTGVASTMSANVDMHDLYKNAVSVSKALRTPKYQGRIANTVRSFLLGKSFRDCSIMLNLQRVYVKDCIKHRQRSIGNQVGYIPEDNGEYAWLYNALVIDTDSRDIHCIPYYDFMEKEILRNYLGEVY